MPIQGSFCRAAVCAPTASNITRGKPAPATVAQSDPLSDVSESLVGRPSTTKPAVRYVQRASRTSRQSQQPHLRGLDFEGLPRPAEALGRTRHRGALERVFARTEDDFRRNGRLVSPTFASPEFVRWTTIRLSGTPQEVSTPRVRSTN